MACSNERSDGGAFLNNDPGFNLWIKSIKKRKNTKADANGDDVIFQASLPSSRGNRLLLSLFSWRVGSTERKQ